MPQATNPKEKSWTCSHIFDHRHVKYYIYCQHCHDNLLCLLVFWGLRAAKGLLVTSRVGTLRDFVNINIVSYCQNPIRWTTDRVQECPLVLSVAGCSSSAPSAATEIDTKSPTWSTSATGSYSHHSWHTKVPPKCDKYL